MMGVRHGGRKPEPSLYVCACGQRKSYSAVRCLTCERLRRHSPPEPRMCEWCGLSFRRKLHGGGGDHDTGRFCSKKCSGARRRAGTMLRLEQQKQQRFASEIERQIQRELDRAQRELERAQRDCAPRFCACGTAITNGSMCQPCATIRKVTGLYAAREMARIAGHEHCCPNCGARFRGLERDVYCSDHCARQLCKRRQRYPAIGHFPLNERNRLAELIALVRSARRRINKPSAVSP